MRFICLKQKKNTTCFGRKPFITPLEKFGKKPKFSQWEKTQDKKTFQKFFQSEHGHVNGYVNANRLYLTCDLNM